MAKYVAQLPTLEARRAEAKWACSEAERDLRDALGRRPIEIERRDDDKWVQCVMAFKEADQALFLARTLTSWGD